MRFDLRDAYETTKLLEGVGTPIGPLLHIGSIAEHVRGKLRSAVCTRRSRR